MCKYSVISVRSFVCEFCDTMFSLFGSDMGTDYLHGCITQHPSFNTVCLQREVLETAIVGLSQARGIRAPRELNNM